MRALFPPLRFGGDAIVAGIAYPDGLRLDSDAMLQHYARTIRAAGGQVLNGRRVAAIRPQWTVTTEGGESCSAPILINAAGAWADQIAALAGVAPLGLKPLRRTIIVVDPPAGADARGWAFVKTAVDDFYILPEGGAARRLAGRRDRGPIPATPSPRITTSPSPPGRSSATRRSPSPASPIAGPAFAPSPPIARRSPASTPQRPASSGSPARAASACRPRRRWPRRSPRSSPVRPGRKRLPKAASCADHLVPGAPALNGPDADRPTPRFRHFERDLGRARRAGPRPHRRDDARAGRGRGEGVRALLCRDGRVRRRLPALARARRRICASIISSTPCSS